MSSYNTTIFTPSFYNGITNFWLGVDYFKKFLATCFAKTKILGVFKQYATLFFNNFFKMYVDNAKEPCLQGK